MPRWSRKAQQIQPAFCSPEAILNYIRVVRTITYHELSQIFDLNRVDGPCLGCPVCGHPNTHVEAVFTLLGGDESGGLYRGSHLVARETPYRRDALAVRVRGECPHRWDLVFQQHTGSTHVRIDVLEDQPVN